MAKWKGAVARSFSPTEFADYVDTLKLDPWIPIGVTVHHTASPSLAQRPNDFTPQHIQNLISFYRDQLKWSACPHLFVDRKRIWVLTPLTTPGIHAVSFNHSHWGLEMLGDYDTETPHPDVLQNTFIACAILLRKIGKTETAVNFHRDDPKTTKTCPGKKISKALVQGGVARALSEHRFPVTIQRSGDPRTDSVKGWIDPAKGSVFAKAGDLERLVGIDTPTLPDATVGVRAFLEALHYTVSYNASTRILTVYLPIS